MLTDSYYREVQMSFVLIPIVVSPEFARFVASELRSHSLSKKDIVKCLKALGIENREILNLKCKEELWIQLQIAAVPRENSAEY